MADILDETDLQILKTLQKLFNLYGCQNRSLQFFDSIQ